MEITMFKNGQPSISMGHLYHGELLVITSWRPQNLPTASGLPAKWPCPWYQGDDDWSGAVPQIWEPQTHKNRSFWVYGHENMEFMINYTSWMSGTSMNWSYRKCRTWKSSNRWKFMEPTRCIPMEWPWCCGHLLRSHRALGILRVWMAVRILMLPKFECGK